MHKPPSAGDQPAGPWAAFWAAVFDAHAEMTHKEPPNESRKFENEKPTEN